MSKTWHCKQKTRENRESRFSINSPDCHILLENINLLVMFLCQFDTQYRQFKAPALLKKVSLSIYASTERFLILKSTRVQKCSVHLLLTLPFWLSKLTKLCLLLWSLIFAAYVLVENHSNRNSSTVVFAVFFRGWGALKHCYIFMRGSIFSGPNCLQSSCFCLVYSIPWECPKYLTQIYGVSLFCFSFLFRCSFSSSWSASFVTSVGFTTFHNIPTWKCWTSLSPPVPSPKTAR